MASIPVIAQKLWSKLVKFIKQLEPVEFVVKPTTVVGVKGYQNSVVAYELEGLVNPE